MEEIWKDIPGYEGLYQASSLGNIRSLNWRGSNTVKNMYLKKSNTGYLTVQLGWKGKPKTFTVHRLVALTFLGNPCGFGEINHKDENKENNSVGNLEWCSHKYNTDYFYDRHPEHGKNKKETDKYGKRLSLRILQCDAYGNVIREWPNSRTIFVQTGMSDWSISQCCRGRQKTAYGYKWRYANEYNSSSETA